MKIVKKMVKKQYIAAILLLALVFVTAMAAGNSISDNKSSIEENTFDILNEASNPFSTESEMQVRTEGYTEESETYVRTEGYTEESETYVQTENYTEEKSETEQEMETKLYVNNNFVEKTVDFEYPENWLNIFNNKVEELKKLFPDGKYWNHSNVESDGTDYMSVTDIPCKHTDNEEKYCNLYNGNSDSAYVFMDTSTQCWGFASLLSDYIFGSDAPAVRFYNYDNLHVGDQARILDDSHTVFIIEKTDDYVIVAECNADYETCMISWGRKIMREDLKGYYITRWNW